MFRLYFWCERICFNHRPALKIVTNSLVFKHIAVYQDFMNHFHLSLRQDVALIYSAWFFFNFVPIKNIKLLKNRGNYCNTKYFYYFTKKTSVLDTLFVIFFVVQVNYLFISIMTEGILFAMICLRNFKNTKKLILMTA